MFHQHNVENNLDQMYSSSEAEEENYSSSEAEENYFSSDDEFEYAENRFIGAMGRGSGAVGNTMMRNGKAFGRGAKRVGGVAAKGLRTKWNEKRGKDKETSLNQIEWNTPLEKNLVYKIFKRYHRQVQDFQTKNKNRSKVTGKKAWKMYFAGKDPVVQFDIFRYWILSHKWKSTVTVHKALKLWTVLQNCLSNSLPPAPAPAPVYQQPPAPVYQQPPAPVYQQPPAPVYQQPPAPVYQQPPAPVYQQPPAPVYQQPPAPAPAAPPAPAPAPAAPPAPALPPPLPPRQ